MAFIQYRELVHKGKELIWCTQLEVDFLQAERARCLRGCPHLDVQRARKSINSWQGWSCQLQVSRRDRDGSLIARVVIARQGSKTRYVRKLRTPGGLASTSDKDVPLRRVAGAA